MLVEYCTTKILKLIKVTFFELLHMDVIDAINNWFTGLEYHDKNKTIPLQIKPQESAVLHMLPFE